MNCDPLEPVNIILIIKEKLEGGKNVEQLFSFGFFPTSRVPWAPHEGGGIVSGRGGELGPDFWNHKSFTSC